MTSFASLLRTVTVGLLGLAIAAAGLLFTLSLTLAGIGAFLAVLVARWWRGQRPLVPRWPEVMAWLMQRMGLRIATPGAGHGAGGGASWGGHGRNNRGKASLQDVVEVGAREVPDVGPTSDRLIDRVS